MHLPHAREAAPKGSSREREVARASRSPVTGKAPLDRAKRVLGEDTQTEQASVNEPGAIARWSPLSTEGALDSPTIHL
jgi:hypothetical protein